jgi:hypothetical protein
LIASDISATAGEEVSFFVKCHFEVIVDGIG